MKTNAITNSVPVAKLKQVITNFGKKLEIKEAVKREEMINKFVQITDFNLPEKTAELLQSARGTLANYAKHEGVNINIINTPKIHGEKENQLIIIITDKLRGIKKNCMLLTNPNQIIHDVRANKVMLLNKDELNYVATVKSHHEDNFLRNLYRTVETMTKQIIEKR